jgi:hypothetical protein
MMTPDHQHQADAPAVLHALRLVLWPVLWQVACQEAPACGAYTAAKSALDQLHAACAAASDAML